MKKTNIIASLIVLGICTYFLIEAQNFSPFGALFPKVVVYILGSLALVLLILNIFAAKPETEKVKIFNTGSVKALTVLIFIALMIGWVVCINFIGFFVSSIVFFSVIMLYLEGKDVKPGILFKHLGIIAGIVIVFYLFFAKVFWVPFPRGILF